MHYTQFTFVSMYPWIDCIAVLCYVRINLFVPQRKQKTEKKKLEKTEKKTKTIKNGHIMLFGMCLVITYMYCDVNKLRCNYVYT